MSEKSAQVGWLVDAVCFESYHDELVKAVEDAGHLAVSVRRPPPPYHWDDVDCCYRNSFPPGSCVVTHGDADLVQRVAKDQLWTPGVFADVSRYHCSHYYAYFGNFVLNNDYMMLPFSELPRLSDFVFENFSVDGRVFVRPDTPLKIFTGQCISQNDFDRDYDYLAFNGFPEESLVVVSTPKRILKEWRFVVVEGRVVAGSEYCDNGTFVARRAEDEQTFDFARKVADCGYQPEPVWVLDICKTNEGRFAVVEVGAFSFAGLYDCDKDAIVRAVSDAALAMHQAKR
ncbi:MAG: ATP-grasp domain-containing protein [Planctomycetota bacterium]